jgi:hypothetical protein
MHDIFRKYFNSSTRYYTFIFSAGVFIFHFLINKVKVVDLLAAYLSSKLGLYSILTIALVLLLLPIGKFLLDDLVMAMILITSFLISLICYSYLTNDTQ